MLTFYNEKCVLSEVQIVYVRFMFCSVCQMCAIIIEDNCAIFEQQQHTWDISATVSFREFHMPRVSFHYLFIYFFWSRSASSHLIRAPLNDSVF